MKDDKPEPLIRGVLEGGCIVERYDFTRGRERKTDKPKQGEPVFLICPICQDEKAPLFPVVSVDRSGKTHINHLMCASDKCEGNTVLDVHKGIVSRDVRILEDE